MVCYTFNPYSKEIACFLKFSHILNINNKNNSFYIFNKLYITNVILTEFLFATSINNKKKNLVFIFSYFILSFLKKYSTNVVYSDLRFRFYDKLSSNFRSSEE